VGFDAAWTEQDVNTFTAQVVNAAAERSASG
jgi:hypothetical protein